LAVGSTSLSSQCETQWPAAQLEAWFLSSHLNPSPSSAVAAVMREMLEKNPGLPFDESRELSRAQMKKIERSGNGLNSQQRAHQ
jgi:hypothetical protein